MTNNMTANAALTEISEHAEQIKNNDTQRFPEAASAGDSWRQGDVYVTLLERVPAGAIAEEVPSLQLAPGSTQGSRHCLDSLEGVSQYRLASPGMLDGPVIDIQHERTVTHPEHGDVILPPGVYGISYQRNLDAEDRERRVLD